MAGFEARRDAFAEQGVKIIAGVVDSEEETQTVAAELGFPVAFGMTKSDGDAMGSWWDERRQCIQPSEFLLSASGRVLISAYSNGPIGRMDPEETLNLVKYLNEQRSRRAINGRRLVGVHVDIEADAQYHRLATLSQNTADLVPTNQHVVRPLGLRSHTARI